MAACKATREWVQRFHDWARDHKLDPDSLGFSPGGMGDVILKCLRTSCPSSCDDCMAHLFTEHEMQADYNDGAGDGESLLQLAVAAVNVKLTGVLLEAGADVTEVDDEGCNVLHTMVLHWPADAMKAVSSSVSAALCVPSEEDPSSHPAHDLFIQPNGKGRTPLREAVREDACPEVLQQLLKLYPDAALEQALVHYDETVMPPLHYTIRKRNAELFSQLLASCVAKDLQCEALFAEDAKGEDVMCWLRRLRDPGLLQAFREHTGQVQCNTLM